MSTGFKNEQTAETQPQTPSQSSESSTTQLQTPSQSSPSSTTQLHTATMSSSDTTQQVLLLLSNADDKTLREIICHCNNVMKSRSHTESALNKQFTVVPDVLSSCTEPSSPTTSNEVGTLHLNTSSATPPESTDDFVKNLTEELETLGLREKSGTAHRRKVASQWLIKSPHQTNLPSEDMDKFPCVSRLRTIVSSVTGGSDFNSCIVNFYADGAARTRPHSDDESYVDQSCPIACFSIGQTREIGLFDKKDGTLIGKHTLPAGSLFVMDSGAQSNTRHQVLPMRSGHCGERFSISFRKIKYSHVENEWPFASKISATPPNRSPPTTTSKTTLVLGTSIPYFLDFDKLAGSSGKVKVVNLCKRGAKINHLHDLLDEHYKKEEPSEIVDKVILSVGTNDLRNNKKSTVGHLYTPMENLVSKIKTYYPDSVIYIQSLLPLRIQNAFTVSNVLGFNKLLVKLAAINKCYYLDIFSQFLGENMHINPTLYRMDGVHLSNKGLSVLARSYISKIRGRFNPVVRV